MPNLIDLIGNTYGRWFVVKNMGKPESGSQSFKWLCKCECGEERSIYGHALRGGTSRSCGCHKELKANRKTHGMANTRLYGVHHSMKSRCNNKNGAAFKNYGGRGITYCKEWENFKPFMEWALSNGYKENLEIDRIEVNGNYEPSNCRFVTTQKNSDNRTTTVYITIKNETKTVSEWSELSGIAAPTIWRRFKVYGFKGIDLLKPTGKRGKRK